MKFIGITGGVGAGKSEVLKYLEKQPDIRVLLADKIAHDLMQPETACYKKLRDAFEGEDIYQPDGKFDKEQLAAVIFSSKEKRDKMNRIVHPAVKEYVVRQLEIERAAGTYSVLVLEAALLIEEQYDAICDELWYIYASEENRRERLKRVRGYSDEKIDGMFKSQLSENAYRESCQVVIDNNGSIEQMREQVDEALASIRSSKTMSKVFGLDIGTRNVVGTVGYYTEDEEFIVTAQYNKQHETRAMLDGQIHDIGRVARTIGIVKAELERQIGEPLTEVCIAAAGRVLKTVTTHVEYEYAEESVVTGEDVHTLNLLGVEKAHNTLKENNDTKYKFYCVGYSVMKYYLNEEPFISIEDHKANKIGEDIIVTFLPEDVVDGLYSAVGQVGLTVANMTLEPIAAINVAIPESFRMLNIALVDVGAGTSDISITKDGTIIAYGMIPCAGDELTEVIVQHFLVDFKTAEAMKLASTVDEEVTYKDIMSISHTIPSSEVWEVVAPVVTKITTEVAEKIKELNGGQTVSACFVVGGGGKIHGFTELLAKELELPEERVALRGEEVLGEIIFEQEDIKKDPLLVTPIGICLNYYEQKNNFIMVRFNGERLKLYDNNRLTIVDAALQAGFPNDHIFPKRGMPINFTVNGAVRIVRGEAGEPAIVRMNGKPANINTPLEPNCEITIEPSTSGEAAKYMIRQLEEYTKATITFEINGTDISCPKFVEVNGKLESEFYEIKEGDEIVTRNYYTVRQIADFMDITIDEDEVIYVNNAEADMDTFVYENFSIEWQEKEDFGSVITSHRSRSLEKEQQRKRAAALAAEAARIAANRPHEEEQAGEAAQPSETAQEGKAEEAGNKEAEEAGSKEAVSKEAKETGNKEAGNKEAGSKEAGNKEAESVSEGEEASEKAAETEAAEPQEAAAKEENASEAQKAINEEKAAEAQKASEVAAKKENASEAAAKEENSAGAEAKEKNSAEAQKAIKEENSAEAQKAAEAAGKEENSAEAQKTINEEKAAEAQKAAGAEAKEGTVREEPTEPKVPEPVEPEKPKITSDGDEIMPDGKKRIVVKVNGEDIELTGKESYIFVDIFDKITFDLQAGKGRAIATLVNGENAQFAAQIHTGDVIELFWREN